jgi:hypothetical protein
VMNAAKENAASAVGRNDDTERIERLMKAAGGDGCERGAWLQ